MSRKNELQIVYHGTNEANAKKILKSGFRRGTYFATHMEDALGYGGKYLFEVMYPSSTIGESQWQFTIAQDLPPSVIVSLTEYKPGEPLVKNEFARSKVYMSNMTTEERKRTREFMIKALEEGIENYPDDALEAWGIKRPAKMHGKQNKRSAKRGPTGLQGVR